MTLEELFANLSRLPGHETVVLEDYRVTQELNDPGNPSKIHFYLTGPDRFYIHLTQIEEGRDTTLDDYTSEVMAEVEMRG